MVAALRALGAEPRLEVMTPDCMFCVDVAVDWRGRWAAARGCEMCWGRQGDLGRGEGEPTPSPCGRLFPRSRKPAPASPRHPAPLLTRNPPPSHPTPSPKPRRYAIEVDGPHHFTLSRPYRPLGRTSARRRCLQARGFWVLSVPFYEWRAVTLRGSGGGGGKERGAAGGEGEGGGAAAVPPAALRRQVAYLRAALEGAASLSLHSLRAEEGAGVGDADGEGWAPEDGEAWAPEDGARGASGEGPRPWLGDRDDARSAGVWDGAWGALPDDAGVASS